MDRNLFREFLELGIKVMALLVLVQIAWILARLPHPAHLPSPPYVTNLPVYPRVDNTLPAPVPCVRVEAPAKR